MSGYIQSNAVVNLPLNSGAGVTITVALTPADSGKVFLMPLPTVNAANVLAITLPAVAISTGVHYKFIVSSSGLTGTEITIGTVGAVNMRSLAVANSAAAGTGGSAADNAFLSVLTFSCVTNGATLTNIGDNVDLFCDGHHWFAQVNTNLANACVLA